MKDAGLYDTDFFEWTLRTAALLRSGRIAEADIEHIAEEIEDMGKRDRRGVYSRLRVLIAHLLKRKLQPERSGASWIETISEQRDRLSLILRDSPSLRRYAASALDEVYADAIRLAQRQTGLQIEDRPEIRFTLDQILDPDFLP